MTVLGYVTFYFFSLQNTLERTRGDKYEVVFRRTWKNFSELLKSKIVSKYCH